MVKLHWGHIYGNYSFSDMNYCGICLWFILSASDSLAALALFKFIYLLTYLLTFNKRCINFHQSIFPQWLDVRLILQSELCEQLQHGHLQARRSWSHHTVTISKVWSTDQQPPSIMLRVAQTMATQHWRLTTIPSFWLKCTYSKLKFCYIFSQWNKSSMTVICMRTNRRINAEFSRCMSITQC